MASDYEVHLTRGQAKAQAKAEADAEAQQIIDRGKPNSLENFQNEFTLKSPTTLPITEPTMCSDSDPSNNCAGPISSHPVTHDTNDTTVPDSQANESPSAEPTAIDSLSDCESFSIPELKPDGIDKKKLISLQQSDTSLSELREKANQHSSNIFYRDSLLMTILTDHGSEHHAIILQNHSDSLSLAWLTTMQVILGLAPLNLLSIIILRGLAYIVTYPHLLRLARSVRCSPKQIQSLLL